MAPNCHRPNETKPTPQSRDFRMRYFKNYDVYNGR